MHHPAVERFIQAFEEEAARNGQYRKHLGKYERKFLEEVWGPAFQYKFDGLRPEYPFKDFKGGDRFADFVYTKGGIRLVIEIDGFTTHARDLSPGDFDDHLMRQNDLILAGWMILRFSAHQVEKRPIICQRQIIQAIGHWWTLAHGSAEGQGLETWDIRKREIIRFGLRRNGSFRAQDVAAEFGVPHRSVLHWLKRLVEEQAIEPIKPNRRIIGYRLSGYAEQ